MNSDEIKRAREISNAATPGPWEHSKNVSSRVNNARTGNLIASTWSEGAEPPESSFYTNAQFIAEARTLLPKALKEIERLNQQITDNCKEEERGFNAWCEKVNYARLKKKEAEDRSQIAVEALARIAKDEGCFGPEEAKGALEKIK